MNGWDMFYDGATSLGGRIAENKREGELTAALRKLFGMDKNSGNTAGNNTDIVADVICKVEDI